MTDPKSRVLATDLSVLATRLTRWLRAADDAPSLSGPEASAMAVVIHSNGITPSRLAQYEQVRRPTITRTIDSLVNRDFVQRDPDPTDRRGTIIQATAAGREMWNAGQARRIEPLAERVSALNMVERRQLEQALLLLEKLVNPTEE